MTNRNQLRSFRTPTRVLNSRGGLWVDTAVGGTRPLDALAWSFSDKTCPEARFHPGRKMMGLRLRLIQELSASFVASCHEAAGQLSFTSSVIVPN